jgi:DNA-binding transcriptional MerR regulator
MDMRVEQLALRSGVAVDTIRYYQSKGLLAAPRREGRVAWYDEDYLARIARIRSLQQRGFTLATIVRLVEGDLDAADEALIGAVSGLPSAEGPVSDSPTPDPPGDGSLTITELATETGVPLALLTALAAERLLIPRRIGGRECYTSEDVDSARAGLLLLEWGIPLSALLDLARRHRDATEEISRRAVALFSEHVRGPLREGTRAGAEGEVPAQRGVEELLEAYQQLLPAVTMLVGHHFTRSLVRAALDHVEQVGSPDERRAIWDQVDLEGAG